MDSLFIFPPELRLDGIPRRPGAAAPVADIYPAACQIREISNMRICPGNYCDEFRIKGYHRSQFTERSAGPSVVAIVRGKLNVGLDDTELQLTATECFNIVYRSRGRLW